MTAYCDNGTRTGVMFLGCSSFILCRTEEEKLLGCTVTSNTPSSLWLTLSLGLLVFGRYRRDET